MLNCTKNWQPIWHNKINYNISGGFLLFPVAWLLLLHLHKIFLLQKPTAGFFPNSFHKKAPSVVWLLLQKKWSSGRTPETKTVSTICKNSFHAPHEKGSGPGSNQRHCKNQFPAIPARTKTQRKEKEHTSSTQAVQNSKAGQTRQRKDSPESTECLSKRRHPTKLGAKPKNSCKNRPELRRVSAKGNCSGSAIADIYISH